MAKKNLKPKKPKNRSRKNYYKLEGGKFVRKPVCPKCGDGVYLGDHKNRQVCGKCGYTKWKQ